jgi:UDP-2,3-diacylglucosamine hydrolase
MKIYFASDLHLGAPYITDHRAHETRIVRWLDKIKADADVIYFLGDIFDYWFEYKHVAPRGFVRFLGKICELTDAGIEVHFFTGNHDVWMFNYLQSECGVMVHSKPTTVTYSNKTFLLHHGDGLGNFEPAYNFMKWIFNCHFIQIIYSWLHPDFTFWFAGVWSRHSRMQHDKHNDPKAFMGPDKEFQLRYAKQLLDAGKKIDYFVFGHRHIILDYQLESARVLVLGEWIKTFSYAVFDGSDIKILHYNES